MQLRTVFICFLTLLATGLSSCKKDLLHWKKDQQIDSHTTHTIDRILFVNDTLGFAVGGLRFTYADILTTHDGGYTWSLETYPEAGKEIYDITAAPDGSLYTCSFDAKMLSSSDNGQTWQFRQLSSWQPYKSVAFPTSAHGLMVGGVSFDFGCTGHVSSDGNVSAYDSVGYELNQIRMLDAQTGFVCGYGVIKKTTDGGNTWRFLNINSDNFKAMDCRNPGCIWTCGYAGSIFKSTDGGESWTRMRNGNDLTIPRYHLYDILFTDDLNGYAVGEDGLVTYTDDGGHHWMEFDRFTKDHLHCIARAPNGDLLVGGENGALYRLQR